MKISFARFGGGGDGVAPPASPTGNAEIPNEVLLGPEESARTSSATTLLDAATVEAIRSGALLVIERSMPVLKITPD